MKKPYKKKILITGASGFVGGHLIEEACNKGYEVHAALRATSKTEHIEPYVDKFVYPDFMKIDQLIDLFNQETYDYIIHGAALTKAKDEKSMFDVNVGVTQNILEAAFSCDLPPKRVVFVSSLAAIGPISYNEGLIKEDSRYNPVTLYGRSKRMAEELVVKHYADKPVTIIRPTAVYGPREKDLFLLFETMYKGLDIYIGREPQKLTFVYVADLVDALLKALEVSEHEKLAIYNITDGEVYSRYAMADVFSDVMRKKMLRMHIPSGIVKGVACFSQGLYKYSEKTPVLYPERLNELTAANWSCDISKSVNELDYSPRYKLARGLKETLNWYKENKWF
ncbi:NAD(P)-dependent oxidoreductase [Sphingobacterium sp. UT-1RO-CII-1]|uniref:NAD-dependent epimerase/dehydratase family protein n=1 Tax=Sphingobacterium sp. UT-1RO-CII-1 TaxID=2995225 RepID=UPI00227A48C1|nr:NAD(P)-dependent oxidoreductase [Sphingobacterium sp. UT-1RO-CII-1]MCY4778019.1 NAD(P)-dependent oxidoreductase [Sphingobacterium sp. UT-1RO-CII-1]